ncbi:hypothetical protein HOM98_02245 [Candidatus Peregrinibacteria bacterium]|nr:hypothetical protein [Candidatus Peregrinibacteria bacterium]
MVRNSLFLSKKDKARWLKNSNQLSNEGMDYVIEELLGDEVGFLKRALYGMPTEKLKKVVREASFLKKKIKRDLEKDLQSQELTKLEGAFQDLT